MTLPELCIRRPVMTSLLMLSFVVFGLFGYRQLPVSALPRVDFPTISVSASRTRSVKAWACSASSVLPAESLDSDGDGVKNIDEIKAGTNPGDPKSK